MQTYTHTNLEKVGCSSDAKATAAVHSESDSARADVSLDSESGCCEENETQLEEKMETISETDS